MSDRTPWFESYEKATNPVETQTFRIHGQEVTLRERTIKVGGGTFQLPPKRIPIHVVDHQDWEELRLSFGDDAPILIRYRQRLSPGVYSSWTLVYEGAWTDSGRDGHTPEGSPEDYLIADVDEAEALDLAQQHLESIGYREPAKAAG